MGAEGTAGRTVTHLANIGPDAFDTIGDAIAAIARGEMIIVVDDPNRENEGDFIMAADAVTPEAINFMVTHGRGLVCMPMEGADLDRLGFRPMVPGAGGTAFTVSIDLKRPRNTGISAHDRARCIERAAAPDADPAEFRTPGHIFPLRARPGGVLKRPGHTEATIDLARLAGRAPSGICCEILNDDGTMARVPDLLVLARRFNMPIVTIEDMIRYRLENETVVERGPEARIPTAWGEFRAVHFRGTHDETDHIALVYGDPHDGDLVRVHSECLTGDVFGSMRCDCGAQLEQSLRRVAEAGAGVVVYLRGHEGRGIGIEHKLRAYVLQDAEELDTVDANTALGLPVDGRDYRVGAAILRELGLRSVRLLTNNPAKREGLERHGVAVEAREPIETVPTVENLRYLQTKRDRLDHDLGLEAMAVAIGGE